MKKLLFSLLVTVALLVGSHPACLAQGPIPIPCREGEIYNPWGTTITTYIVGSINNLLWIAAPDSLVPNPPRSERMKMYYYQPYDIDAVNTKFWYPNGSGGFKGFIPIGTALEPFGGEYDGRGHVIDRLYINRPELDYVGLFGCAAKVIFLAVSDASITGKNYVGGLAGKGVTISQSFTTGIITGQSNVGGLVGEGDRIWSCNSTASVNGYTNVGGLIGWNDTSDPTIVDCYAAGSVIGTGSQVGGLIGFSSGAGNIQNCFWDTQTSGQSTSSGGAGKPTGLMKLKTTFTDAGWNVGDGHTWKIFQDGNYVSYPYLSGVCPKNPTGFSSYWGYPASENTYSGGNGTSGNPYQITNWLQLRRVEIELSAFFILNNDLNAGGSGYADYASATANGGSGWAPVGNATTKFTGNFNGNYHTITGLYINRPATDDIGLFGYVGSSGSISNAGLVNVTVTGKENVGGLVGYFKAATGSIANTYVTGNLSAQTDVGGLAGEILYGTVTNVYSTANVTGDRGVGGLMGSASEDNITNAYSTGLVTGNSYVGGLLGYEWYTTVTNSFWDKQTSGQNSSYSNKGTGKTTSEMKLQNTFTGWDFAANTGKWQIKEIASLYKSYPYLQGFTYDEPDASPVVNPIPGLADLYYSGGTGTLENPYQIATLDDLQYLSEHSGDWWKYFIQTANIDAAATSGWNGGAGFSPIGNSTTAFTGNYNGQNHTIAGLFINRPATENIGMFGYNTGTISNLGLTNVNITGGYRVGGLVGMDDPGANITRVYTTGSVTANTGDGGGLVGIHNNGTISNGYSRASVSGAGCRGGLIGWYQGGTVSNVYSTGSVSSSGACIGGLIGGSNGFVTGGFWDTQTSGQATSAGGTGKTTAGMKTALTFVGNCWDFQVETGNGTNDYWGINATDNGGYPFLSWQGYTNTATYQSTITIGTTTSPTCGWSISGGVLTASTDVTINVNDINAALIAGNLTIQASNDIIINTAIEPALTAASTLTLKAGGNISMADYVSLTPSTEFALNTIFWSDVDATNGGAVALNSSASINTKGGHLWIGGGSGSADWNGLIVGNGWAKSTSGDAVALTLATISTSGGDIQINGESTATEIGSDGISISSESTILAGAGNISLYGIGGQAQGGGADCDGIRVDGSITTSTGNITLTGASTTEGLNEGIAVQSNITSTSGNISLITNIFWMSADPLIGSTVYLTLKPFTDGSTIGIAGGAGTLSLPTDYFTTNFVGGFSGIIIGSSTAGNIGIIAIPFKDPVTFNANGNLNLENDFDLNGQTITLGNEITLNESSGRFYGTSGSITTTRNLSNISAVNVAGLGAVITTSANMGATTITRGHTNQSWGGKNSVLRYYNIAPSNNTGLNATLVYNYKDTELNGLTENKLFLYKSTDGGFAYSCEGGTVNTSANTITLSGIGGFSRWMAAERMTLTWNGAGSDFNTAANWAPNATPSTFYNLTIPDVATDPIVNQAPATPAVCNDLAIASGAVLTIPSGQTLTVNGILTNSGGNASLVVNSGGSLIQNSANVPATVERIISAWGTAPLDPHGWHFLSSPVAAQSIASAFTADPSANYDFYSWWEPTNQWVNYKNTTVAPVWITANVLGVTSGAGNFIAGKGYLVEYKDSGTKQFAGTLNKDNIAVSNLAISSGDNRGWHLLGNPFPSALTWGTSDWLLSAGNINATAKIWNESTAAYIDLAAGTGIIPALNGFMVQVTTGTGSLTVPAAARVHHTTAWYKSSENPSIVLVANDAAGQTAQESIIRFDNEATSGFDNGFDSHFLAGYAPTFYSVAGEHQLSTNSLPEAGGTVQVPFDFIKNDGFIFTIEAKTISDLQGPVILNDLKTGATQDLTLNPVYSFSSAEGDRPNRFLITFSHVGLNEAQKENPITVFSSNHEIFVISNSTGDGKVLVYNMMGQLLAQQKLTGSQTKINLNSCTGYYLVKVVTNENAYSEKVFVK